MLPTLGHIGPITLYTYTVLIDLGIVLALAALYLRAPADRRTRWLDVGLVATLGAFAGARLLYVIVNGDYYFPHLDEIFQIWQGGLAWPGAVAGGLLAAWAYCQRRGEPLAPVLDAVALPMGVIGGLGWGGCLAAGCAYGFEVTPGAWPAWLTTTAPDLYGLVVPRFPTQALGVLWSAFALLALWGVTRSAAAQPARAWPVGAYGWYAISLVALGAFGLSFARADPIVTVAGVRIDVIGSAIVLVAASLAWGRLVARPPTARLSTAGPQMADS